MNCKKCNKFLIRETKNGYCRECARDVKYEKYNIVHRQKLLKEHRCFNCCKKVEPIKCPCCKVILKYPIRCKKCSKKARDKTQARKRRNTQEETNALKGGFN